MKLKYISAILFFALLLLISSTASAHCDSMEGPVVKASQKSLETGNLNYVLIWIKPEYESQVIDLFKKVTEVRNLNEKVKELADYYFFETVVRLHRLGEGESYTGLKPAGYKPGVGIESADLAIEKNSISPVLSILAAEYHAEATNLFNDLMNKKNYDINDVNSGRKYVASYVHFIHYVAELSGEAEHEE
jgi:hypothetical protein